MRPALRDRHGRVIAAMLAALLLAALVFLARGIAAGAREARAELSALKADLARIDSLKAEISALKPAGGEGGAFVDAASSAQAIAAVQEALKGVISGAGGEAVSIESRSAGFDGAVERLSFKVSLELPEDRLPSFLQALETMRPILLQSRVAIRRQTMFQRFSTEEAGPRLTLQFELSAFRRKEAA